MNCEVRQATIKDTEEIIEILNRVTLHLNSKGVYQWDYPWSFEAIEKDIFNKNVYIVYCNNIVAGTFGLRKLEEEKFELMQVDDYYLYRVALLPELQGLGIGVEIVKYAFKFVDTQQNTLYLDCYYGNKSLREFYLKSGMEYVGDYPEEDYFVSVFKH